MLTHTTKRRLNCSGLITKNLVGKGNRSTDSCYNDSMTIAPLAQTSFSNLLLYYIILNQHVVLATH